MEARRERIETCSWPCCFGTREETRSKTTHEALRPFYPFRNIVGVFVEAARVAWASGQSHAAVGVIPVGNTCAFSPLLMT